MLLLKEVVRLKNIDKYVDRFNKEMNFSVYEELNL
jgi:hypothetical protein